MDPWDIQGGCIQIESMGGHGIILGKTGRVGGHKKEITIGRGHSWKKDGITLS